jgi:hypothetical protein
MGTIGKKGSTRLILFGIHLSVNYSGKCIVYTSYISGIIALLLVIYQKQCPNR